MREAKFRKQKGVKMKTLILIAALSTSQIFAWGYWEQMAMEQIKHNQRMQIQQQQLEEQRKQTEIMKKDSRIKELELALKKEKRKSKEEEE